jgi:hypothetical protein
MVNDGFVRSAFAAMLALGLTVPASAATLQFTLSGAYSAQWEMDEMPVPTSFDATSFRLANVPGNFAGVAAPVTLFFFTAAASPNVGGLGVLGSDLKGYGVSGEQLFTGSTAAPTMRIGSFTLDGIFLDPERLELVTVSDAFSLRIGPSVPEPASWALMAAGFGLAGAVLRGRAASI